jgi:hypothetical protein
MGGKINKGGSMFFLMDYHFLDDIDDILGAFLYFVSCHNYLLKCQA